MKNRQIDFTQRNIAIDILRAVTMCVMIFVNDFWTVHDIPHYLEHAAHNEDFMGLADVVFPTFLFAVGMSIPFAIERRYMKGMSGESTILHILSRTFALLVMGAFIVNSESGMEDDALFPIGVYWLMMVVAFICVWNQYPHTENPSRLLLFRGLKWMGVLMLLFLAITFKSKSGDYFSARWWGILGLIGWTYVVCALIYVFVRKRISVLIGIWVAFLLICILTSPMNEAHGSKTLFNLPLPNILQDFLNILHIGNGGLPALTMGGMILSLLSTQYTSTEKRKKVYFIICAVLGLCIAGYFSRHFWILSKIGATLPWIFYVSAIATTAYALFYWMEEKGWTSWFAIIRPAGTATLTTYLMPYVAYALSALLGIHMPDALTHGFIGILNCVCFSLLIVWFTGLLGKAYIKLKI